MSSETKIPKATNTVQTLGGGSSPIRQRGIVATTSATGIGGGIVIGFGASQSAGSVSKGESSIGGGIVRWCSWIRKSGSVLHLLPDYRERVNAINHARLRNTGFT